LAADHPITSAVVTRGMLASCEPKRARTGHCAADGVARAQLTPTHVDLQSRSMEKPVRDALAATLTASGIPHHLVAFGNLPVPAPALVCFKPAPRASHGWPS
jgi:hypothetical protein